MYTIRMFISLLVIIPLVTTEVPRPRGVSITKASYYVLSGEFTCLDGSQTIPFEHVNDDYCDCKDSSDEPGTAACPNGSFHCTNAGHKPLYIPSSHVNDGICDCCDGADEYGHSQCSNVCKQLGQVAHEENERQKLLQQEGHTIYQEYIKQGQQATTERKGRLEQLEKSKNDMQLHLDELEIIKNDAERPEKESKEKHQKEWEDEKKMQEVGENMANVINAFTDLDTNMDSRISVDEMQQHLEFDIDSSGDVSVEEAKEYLEDYESVDLEFFKSDIWPNIESIYMTSSPGLSTDDESVSDDPTKMDNTHEDDEHYYDEDEEDEYDDDHHSHGDDMDAEDEDDDNSTVESSSGDEPEMPEYDQETKDLIEAAGKARNEFNEADKKFKDVDKEINDINKFLNMDFGENKQFFTLKDQCYEFTDLQYTYKMCAFDKTTQRSKSGGAEHNLGKWGHWDGPEGSKYSAMLYEKGQNCWNGPDRSTKVILSCGLNNELVSASEPNRCEYQFEFLTPAACSQQPQPSADHDEL